MLDAVGLGDHRDPAFTDREAASPIVFGIEADLGIGGNADPFVDNRPANLRAAANIDAFEQDRILDPREAVDARVGTKDRPLDVAARHDRTGADDAVEGLAASAVVA